MHERYSCRHLDPSFSLPNQHRYPASRSDRVPSPCFESKQASACASHLRCRRGATFVKIGSTALRLEASCRRGFASCPTIRNSAESETSLPEQTGRVKLHTLSRLQHDLAEPLELSQESLIEQLDDDQVANLPLVISSGNGWGRLESSISLPRRGRRYRSGDARLQTSCPEYLYNTFSFDSQQRLKRFNREIAEELDTKANVHPVMLVDPGSRTHTIGLPSYIGLESPQRGKEHCLQDSGTAGPIPSARPLGSREAEDRSPVAIARGSKRLQRCIPRFQHLRL